MTRAVQDADGELTEANFGNDDETMGRLEDMGVPSSGLVGSDVTRQNEVFAFQSAGNSDLLMVPYDLRV